MIRMMMTLTTMMMMMTVMKMITMMTKYKIHCLFKEFLICLFIDGFTFLFLLKKDEDREQLALHPAP